jgi:hypothetical protein
VGVLCNNYDGILARLNEEGTSGGPFLFINRTGCSFILGSVNVRVPIRIF